MDSSRLRLAPCLFLLKANMDRESIIAAILGSNDRYGKYYRGLGIV